jgi:hypothetical protein
MASQLGVVFRVATFGESHGGGVGVVVDGCPPRLELAVEEIQRDLDRRRPGQSRLTTPRQEADRVELLSGVFEGRTLGSPIAMLVRNEDARPASYEQMKDVYRPSHADWTTEAKYACDSLKFKKPGPASSALSALVFERSSAAEIFEAVSRGLSLFFDAICMARFVVRSPWDGFFVGETVTSPGSVGKPAFPAAAAIASASSRTVSSNGWMINKGVPP